MEHAVLGARVHADIFSEVQRVAKGEGISVSRLLKKAMYDYTVRRADLCVDIRDAIANDPKGAALAEEKARAYLQLARAFKKVNFEVE